MTIQTMAKLPHSTKQWVLRGTSIDGLTLEDVPLSDELGEYEVLVKFHAASLNYRDVMITTVCLSLSSVDGCWLSLNSRADSYLDHRAHTSSPKRKSSSPCTYQHHLSCQQS
jgi:hypothetical protein